MPGGPSTRLAGMGNPLTYVNVPFLRCPLAARPGPSPSSISTAASKFTASVFNRASMPDTNEVNFVLAPFRYQRQRHTTLMVRVKRSFLHGILWPEYCELRDALNECLVEATDRIIREEVFDNSSEAQERA